MPDTLPCAGQTTLYDAALYSDDVPPALRARAVRQAAALCATCPSPCDQQVTASTSHAMAPAALDGGCIRRPEERVSAWAHMAAERAAAGQSLADIAVDLWVDEATAAALIKQAQTLGRAA
ncbi:hypothetical protein [Streptomyces sp. NPDC058629]|uniref:hypothetical protein n=1 Tax=Streptomyces sp. NPDC058629 TaxID=3346565 RepID=UPI003659D9A9